MIESIIHWKLYSLMAALIVTGALNGILAKLQSNTNVDDHPWEHPWFQTFLMFLGESL